MLWPRFRIKAVETENTLTYNAKGHTVFVPVESILHMKHM